MKKRGIFFDEKLFKKENFNTLYINIYNENICLIVQKILMTFRMIILIINSDGNNITCHFHFSPLPLPIFPVCISLWKGSNCWHLLLMCRVGSSLYQPHYLQHTLIQRWWPRNRTLVNNCSHNPRILCLLVDMIQMEEANGNIIYIYIKLKQ